MAYDEGLAERISDYFGDRLDIEQKKMFGGLCFMAKVHMCCGIVGDTLMVRVGAEAYEEYLNKEHVREMNFTGRAMKAMIYVSPDGIESDHNLHQRIGIC